MSINPADALSEIADPEFVSLAGPAVLRLKLLEVTWLSESRHCSDNMREVARAAADELRRLIATKPCVSHVDRLAQSGVSFANVCRLGDDTTEGRTAAASQMKCSYRAAAGREQEELSERRAS